ncbi:PaaX family transcriptional regulator C-terminal domain-containing protein [Roseobacteraceae bacterium S113]
MTPEIRTQIDALTQGQTPRVWSFIVTIFGDLAQDGRLSGASLSALTLPLGIKAEAMRVALHRLRGDGWLESEKRGRARDYRLTDWGRAQARAASQRIYGLDGHSKLAIFIIPNGAQLPEGMRTLTQTLALGPVDLEYDAALRLPLEGAEIWPAWLRARVVDEDVLQSLARITPELERSADLSATTQAPLADRLALRLAAVHEWRRVILRVPDGPAGIYPDGWVGPRAATALKRVLEACPAPNPETLEAALKTPAPT